MKYGLIILAILLSSNAYAKKFHKCEDATGRITYSQAPCKGKKETIKIQEMSGLSATPKKQRKRVAVKHVDRTQPTPAVRHRAAQTKLSKREQKKLTRLYKDVGKVLAQSKSKKVSRYQTHSKLLKLRNEIKRLKAKEG